MDDIHIYDEYLPTEFLFSDSFIEKVKKEVKDILKKFKPKK